jgi:lysophospholipase L1-like esterase
LRTIRTGGIKRLAVLAACAALGCAGRGRMEEGRVSETGVRYLALGDSYTIGEGVEDGERWPALLAAMLRARGIAVADPEIVARTGWTTDELDAAIDQAAPRGPYALVSLLIGVNDQYRGGAESIYREQFTGLLRRAIGFAGGDASRVVVLSIPDRGRIASEIDAFNAAAREVTAELGARRVDVTPASREAGSDPAMLVADGLHPSSRQYARWAELALPAAVAALGR